MRLGVLRPLAGGAALAVVVPIAFGIAPASAAATKSGGDASSTATVLSLKVLGQAVTAVQATLSATNRGKPGSAIDVVPISLNGTGQTIHLANGTTNIGGATQSVANVVSLTSPGMKLTSVADATTAVASLATTSLGSASVLGVALKPFTGTLNFGSSALSGYSDSSKGVKIKNLALPGLLDLLNQLGYDLSALSTSTLNALVTGLQLVSSATTAANAAVNVTSNALTNANTDVIAKTTALNAAIAAAPFSNAAIVTLLGTLGVSAPANAADWNALNASQQSQLVSALDTVTSGTGTAIATAATALATATVLVTTLTNLLTNLFNTLKTVLLNALNSPLLSLGSLDISTVAQSGSKNAAKVVGAVSGLKVLGTDVIKTVTGSSTIDLLDLVGSTLSQVQGAISTVTNQLTTVLDNVLGLTVPLPTVAVLTKSTSLDKVGADTSALATVTGLTFKWAGLLSQQEVIPRAAVAPLAVSFGDPFSIEAKIATLADQSSYTTVAATTPTTVTPGNTPDLANTGLPVGVSVTAALMLLAAYAVRRFRRSEKFLTATD